MSATNREHLPSQDQQPSPCDSCAVRDFNICRVLLGKAGGGPHRETAPLSQIHLRARAREIIYSENDTSETVGMICDGWACAFVLLPDGRRQVLTTLLPGDIVSATALLKDRVGFSVQALTEVRYCKFNRSELRALLIKEPAVFEEFSKR